MKLESTKPTTPRERQVATQTISLYDVMLLFVLKAPDQKKAVAALQLVFDPAAIEGMIKYGKKFKTYQDWRNHLATALDNAQEKVDATKTKP